MTYVTEFATTVETTAIESFQANTTNTDSRSKVIVVQMSFEQSLRRIELAKARSRNAYYEFLASILKAYEIGFVHKTITKDALKANTKLLNEKCDKDGIVGKSNLHKLVKLALGPDAKTASSVVHVLKVAQNLGATSERFVQWIKDQGGFQNVRVTYDEDGIEKLQSTTNKKKRNGPTDDKSEDEKQYATKARQNLADTVIFTIPHGQIGLIAEPGEEAECTAILLQRADGSFAIKAVINDETLVDSAYVAFGRKPSTTDDQQPN